MVLTCAEGLRMGTRETLEQATVAVRLAVRRGLARTERDRVTYRREWRFPLSAWRLAMSRAWGWVPRLSDEVLFMRAERRAAGVR